MKKHIFILSFFLFAAVIANAQCLLRVHLADNSRIHVSVNGRYFNKRGTTVTVGDLPPGRHFLKIYSTTYDRWGRMYDRLVYQGTVNTSYGMITNFLFDPVGRRISMRNNPIDANSQGGYVQNQPSNNQYGGNNNDGSGDYEPSSDNAMPQQPSGGMQNNNQPNMPAASPVPTGTLTEEKSDKLKAKVDAKGTDTEKLKLIKDALKKETVTTFQVSYMMDWFLFESSKVDFAKWAYSITTDKGFYSDLSSKFNYSSSKEELQQFLQTRR